MTMVFTRRSSVVAGLVAGLVCGLLLDLFLLAVQWPAHGAAGIVPFFQHVAATVIPKDAASATPSTAWLGLALHFAVSIMWAYGYVYLSQRQSQLISNPLVSGIWFGVLIWFVMQVVLVLAGAFERPTFLSFEIGMISHTIFFAIPLAFIVSRFARAV